jgi:fluoride exporter
MLLRLSLIFLGGGIGAVLRYLVSGWAQRLTTGVFPLGTLAVNVIGCGLIGAAMAFFATPHRVREEYRLMLLVGVLGGFTTFSTFAYETFAMADDAEHGRALLNIILSNALGLATAWAAYRLTQRLYGG